jgi:hypothetical protein
MKDTAIEKDTALEEMFARYQPDLGDSEKYMEALSKKLEAVEFVKQYQEVQVRRHRKIMALVFAMGVLTGALGIILTLLHPFWTLPPVNIPVLPAQNYLHLPNIGFLLAVCLTSLGFTGLVVQGVALRERG